MLLPNFSNLCIGEPLRARPSSIREEWLAACGTRPILAKWKNMRGEHKRRLLHAAAERADDDEAEDGNYVSVYEEIDIDDIPSNRRSVEHVIPRSRVQGRESAESDPIGWVEATRSANSRRSNYPLYLWKEPDGKFAIPNTLVRVDGTLHYVPPFNQRARLARKWLCMRATYTDEVDPPTPAQRARAAQIVALAQHFPIQPAEQRVNDEYRRTIRWANPLLEANSERWYADAAWRAMVFA